MDMMAILEEHKKVDSMPLAVYQHVCPNCGGSISSTRLKLGVPCKNCLPVGIHEISKAKESMSRIDFLKFIKSKIVINGKFVRVIDLELETEKINDMARRVLGNDLWSAQRAWVKRLIKGYSFSVTAPTGLGKTFFGIISSIYLSTQNKRVLILVPTVALVLHVLDRIRNYLDKLGLGGNIVFGGYYTGMDKKERERLDSLVREGKINILVMTSMGLARSFDKIRHIKFDLVFVDDVDALLKSSKNIDRILLLIGFKQEHIERALELVRKQQYIAFMSDKEKNELYEEVMAFRSEIEKFRKNNGVGQLIVSTATGTVRGSRVRVLRELLNFTIGSSRGGLRNIVDTYYLKGEKEGIVVPKIAKLLGRGGLIFVYRAHKDLIDELITQLEAMGFRVGNATGHTDIGKLIDQFARGELDILVGVASYYGRLARGIDLPQVVRYAIFVGVPHFRFKLEIAENTHPMRSFSFLNEVVDYIEDMHKRASILRILNLFRRKFFSLAPYVRQEIIKAVTEGNNVESQYLQRLVELAKNMNKIASKLARDKTIIENLKKNPFVEITEESDGVYIHIPDAKTYIQCSGRTSRMYAGGITLGLSVVVTSRKRLLDALMRRVKWYVEDIEWKNFKEVNLEEIIKRIDKDRETVRAIVSGKIPPGFKELMRSALMIVESPTKAKTIARFFGRPARRIINGIPFYEVSTGDYILTIVASRGHVYDLILEDPDISNIKALQRFFDTEKHLYGVDIVKDGRRRYYIPILDVISTCRDCGKKFTGIHDKCPRCGSTNIHSQWEIVDALREIGNEVDIVFIATDPDTEGERIGFDLALTLQPLVPEIKRVEYHAVTLSEIRRAFQEMKTLDINRVKAQFVRRILDRWVGFAYSHLLWMLNNIAERKGTYSAGRVQTPVLGWVIERYNEYRKSMTRMYFIHLENGYVFSLEETPELKDYWKELKGKYISVRKVDEWEETLNPPPPYNTAEVLRDISSKLKISSFDAMHILQELFESGLITYHRTDSTRVSPEGINVAKEYIKNTFGGLNLFQPRMWSSEEEEGAHECIRPTKPLPAESIFRMLQTGELVLNIRFTRKHYAVYQLIFNRFIASQMKPAKIRKVRFVLELPDMNISHVVEGIESIIEEGFTKILPPKLMDKFKDKLKIIDVKKARVAKVPLYTESDIIEKMKTEGIGRPSTYAIILETLRKRGYVGLSQYKKKLYPTKKGITTYHVLMEALEHYISKLEKRRKAIAENLKKVVTVEGTRELENIMDRIEEGKVDYMKVLDMMYEALKIVLNDLRKYYQTVLIPQLVELNNKKRS